VDAVEQVGAEAANLTEGRSALIITDPGIVRAGLLDRIVRSLGSHGFAVAVCDCARPEPALDVYRAALAAAREHAPDLIVGVGGGSSLDVAKVVARALTMSTPLEEALGLELVADGRPLITVPTTSGTGAEVTPDAVVLLPEERVKSGFYNARATTAIVDPTMMLSLPPRLTAACGIDALSHAIESALSKIASPLTQALALESVRLIATNLRTAVRNGSDLEARTNMAWATLIEGLAESNAGDVEGHAVAHVLGGYYRIHHGAACAIALPYCMKYNLDVNTPILARIAHAMDSQIAGSEREMAVQGIWAVHRLIDEVGLITHLGEVEGALPAHIPDLVALYRNHPAITEIFHLFCRRGVPTEAEATEFLTEIFHPFRQ
jgi:alcohol dehydrogenase